MQFVKSQQIITPEKTVADFFAGIGLVELGLKKAGWSTIYAVDYSDEKRQIYEGNFGQGSYQLRDIRTVDGEEIPPVALAHASFPCTDVSVAGGRAGLSGKETSSFWEFVRILEEMKTKHPSPFILLENVEGMLTSKGGRDLEIALSALCELGYALDILLINASHFVPQSRARLFIVGNLLADHQDILTLNSTCKCNRFGSWHRKGQLVYFPWPLQTQLPTEALMGTYHQLTEHQRYQIYALKKAGHDQQSIAATVSVSLSTICRELQRNRGQRGYRPGQAHQQALARRRHKAKATKMTAAVIERIEADLGQEWSPEQIAGRLAATDGLRLSPQRIYQHIQADRQAGGTLYRHLRHSQKKRKKRDGKADARGQIKGRVSIDQRPAIVEEKSRIGDWEIDLVMGRARTGALVSVVERRSRYTVLGKVPSKHAEQVAATTIGLLAPHKGHTQTITADNGKEFAHHATISQALDAAVYFARSLSCLGAGTQREHQWADSPVCAQRHGLGYAVGGTDTPHHGSAQSSAAKGLGFSNAP